MANTFSVTSVIDHTSDAAYHTWVAEVIAALFTSIGLTQTADTGQTTNGGTVRPGSNTAGGYVIGRFNDTLQSTSPVFFKIEFGTGSAATSPMMWITVGTASNGSGTITGTTMTKSPVMNGSAPGSTVTSYVSRYVWNPTYGYFGMVLKMNAALAGSAIGGAIVARSTNTSGAATSDAVLLIANSDVGNGAGGNASSMQVYSYLLAGLVTIPTKTAWAFWPFALTTTVVSSQIQVMPIFSMTPILFVHACMCIGLTAETPIGNTATPFALVGAPTLTFLSCGSPFGNTGSWAQNLSQANQTFMMLWQ